MKLLLSPSKSLDFRTSSVVEKKSDIVFAKEAIKIQEVLKYKKPKELQKIMGISEKLADLNWKRNNLWEWPFQKGKSKQAVYAFIGDVYTGLDVASLPYSSIGYMQNSLRILSGLYGILRPLDQIMPYRLEMGTVISIGSSKDLYEFWGTKLTDFLNYDANKKEVIVNLASNEYFRAIKVKSLKNRLVEPKFKEFKNGFLKTIPFFAKKARGMMSRFCIENKLESVEYLKEFKEGGYVFDAFLSDEINWVFTR